MFQNIENNKVQEDTDEDGQYNKKKDRNEKLKTLFSVQNIVLYAIVCMVSMVSFNGELAPFGLAIFAAVCSNKIPARDSIYCMLNWYIYRLWD